MKSFLPLLLLVISGVLSEEDAQETSPDCVGSEGGDKYFKDNDTEITVNVCGEDG